MIRMMERSRANLSTWHVVANIVAAAAIVLLGVAADMVAHVVQQ
jgi:hypothetical protein